ncbi:MAG: phosphate acyltransferase PlsX [Bradymonadales bacterium]|nr:MAG: phosphate acyltransferase PlsX [Bradymonadales bacterium]
MKVSVALDAMGGDFLAVPNLRGAYAAVAEAATEGTDLKVYLCGPEALLMQTLEEISDDPQQARSSEYRILRSQFEAYLESGRLEIVDCPDFVEMDENPLSAVRSKKKSSMAAAYQLVKSGQAASAISAGNSGAMMAYGIQILGRLSNVRRPAILCHFPSSKGVSALLDAGANVDCRPEHLLQFAQMGILHMQKLFQVEKPEVAILNIGEEEGKGNELVKEAHQLLRKKMPSAYVGFVEGRDILTGKVDVIVCDGFVGNVVLKTAEGVAQAVRSILKEEMSRNPIWGLGAWLAKGGFMAMKNKLDYREYGAAPLIGLNGVGLVAHGSSDARAIHSAIRIGVHYAHSTFLTELSEELARLKEAN